MIGQKKILTYWKKYFPEVKEQDLPIVIDCIADINWDDLITQYNNYEENENSIGEYVEFQYCDLINKYYGELHTHERYAPCLLPLINKHLRALDTLYLHNDLLSDKEGFWIEVLKNLMDKLFQIAYKSLIYEVNYLGNHKKLMGDTPEERMEYFLSEYIQKPEYLASFYMEYFALTKVASEQAQWVLRFISEILDNLEEQKAALQKIVGRGITKHCLKTISLGAGDTHRRGRTVAVIEFTDGGKLLYKPHSLLIDMKFANLLSWLNEAIPNFLDCWVPKSITVQEYGFAEFAEHKACSDDEEVKRFYRRMGQLLCILYSINSSDFHYENVISCGEYPVLIDLETLLHSGIVLKNDQEKISAYRKAEEKHMSSVATVGLLPLYAFGNLEIGGLGAEKVQESPFKGSFIEDMDKDTVHVCRKTFSVEPQINNPVIDDQIADSSHYVEDIKVGFYMVYEWMRRNKTVYLEKVTDLFSGCPCRLVVRPTMFYSQLLQIAHHPNFTRKIYERHLIFCRTAIEPYKDYPGLVRAEHEDLMGGDVPFFSTIVGQTSIKDSRDCILEDMQVYPILSEIRDKVEGFSETDRDLQMSYIDGSYINRSHQSDETGLKWHADLDIGVLQSIDIFHKKLTPEKWLDTAISIGELIQENAIYGMNSKGNKDSAWLCVTINGFEEDLWIPSVLSEEFYSGNSGIAFFLVYLWKITGKPSFLETARAAAEIPLMLLDEKYVNQNTPLGAFSGIGGSLYMLAALAEVTHDQELRHEVENRMLLYGKCLQDDEMYDVVAGCAGYLAVALKLAKGSERQEEFTTLISDCVTHLLRKAFRGEGTLRWQGFKDKSYTGFSHGNAGINAFLGKAIVYLGHQDNPEWWKWLEPSRAYERECFSPQEGNWRRSHEDTMISDAWCHGAPGMLLSRLLLCESGIKWPEQNEEIQAAFQRTTERGIGNNPTYCHGDLGSLAVLKYAARVLGSPSLENASYDAYQQLYDTILSKQWNKKRMKPCHTYGLMIGLAGWGYSMLSNYASLESECTPEFLWLE